MNRKQRKISDSLKFLNNYDRNLRSYIEDTIDYIVDEIIDSIDISRIIKGAAEDICNCKISDSSISNLKIDKTKLLLLFMSGATNENTKDYLISLFIDLFELESEELELEESDKEDEDK